MNLNAECGIRNAEYKGTSNFGLRSSNLQAVISSLQAFKQFIPHSAFRI